MKTKRIHIQYLLLLGLISLISSCVRIDFDDPCTDDNVDQPTYTSSSVTLITDWSKRSSDVDIPPYYYVSLGDQILKYETLSNVLPHKDPESYPTLIYNNANKVTVEGNIAQVSKQGEYLDTDPEYFFSAYADIVYEADVHKTQLVKMTQQIRHFIIELDLSDEGADNIESIDAVLTGVASHLDMTSDKHLGYGAKVKPTFVKDGNKWVTNMWLLGIVPEDKQTFTLEFTFRDGSKQTIEYDLSGKLVDFNKDKEKPFKITASGNITIGEPVFIANINDWIIVDMAIGSAWS